MTNLVAAHHHHRTHLPPPHSLSNFNTTSLHSHTTPPHLSPKQHHPVGKLWVSQSGPSTTTLHQPKPPPANSVATSSQGSWCTRTKPLIIQQVPSEADQDYADFLSKWFIDQKNELVYVPNGLELIVNNDFATYTIYMSQKTKAFAVPRRNAMAMILSSYIFSKFGSSATAFAQQSVGFREYIDTFDGYSFKYPQNWIQVRGAGADIFFRDPFVLDENVSVDVSSPSSSKYKSVEDLGPPQEAGEKVLKQYLTEFMSTRLGVKRKSSILSTSSRFADDGRIYYLVEVNIKSFANNNELAVMPQDRVVSLEWDRRYLSVLGVENNRLYALRLQTPENVFAEEESDLRTVIDSFRVNKVSA